MTPPEQSLPETNRRAQQELYGDTLETRLGAITRAYGIPQRRLARALGISAPMLSQLISAKRVKMGNPLAHERMAALEHRATEVTGPDVAERILEEVGASDIATTTQMRSRPHEQRPAEDGAPETVPAAEALRDEVPGPELRAARDLLAAHEVAPHLRALLEDALE